MLASCHAQLPYNCVGLFTVKAEQLSRKSLSDEAVRKQSLIPYKCLTIKSNRCQRRDFPYFFVHLDRSLNEKFIFKVGFCSNARIHFCVQCSDLHICFLMNNLFIIRRYYAMLLASFQTFVNKIRMK